MKRVLVVLAVLGAMVVVPSVGAQAASGAKVTVVQAATYSSTSAFPLTVCIDGTSIADNVAAGTTLSPETLIAGPHTIDFVQGTDCTADPFVSNNFTVADGDNITLMSYWGRDARGVAALANDESCIPEGTARLTVRNAASTSSDAPVSFLVTPQGGAEETVVSELVVGTQKKGSVAAGDYSSGRFALTTGGATLVSLPAKTFDSGEHGNLYVYGGNDGEIGYFFTTETLTTCVVPATTTAPPTTTPAPAVIAAAIAPHFTG